MKAINYFLVVENIKEEPKKVAGLIMTEATDEEGRYKKATVISAGDKIEGISNGDTVHYDKHAGSAITWKDKVYFVVKISDIVTVE